MEGRSSAPHLGAPLLVILVGACPVPLVQPGETTFACSVGAQCSDGFVCVDGVCVSLSSDAGLVPRDGAMTDGPMADAPMTDVPMADAPMTDVPMTDVPMTDAAMTDAAMTDAAMTDVPMTDGPMTDGPMTDTPTADASLADVPMTDTPTADASLADVPMTDTPTADASLADVPMADVPMADVLMPDTSLPDTSLPDTSLPDTSIPDTSLPDTSLPDTSLPDTVAVDAGAGRIDQDIYLLYTFDEGQGDIVYDVSGVGSAVDLTIANMAGVSWLPDGLEANSAGVLTLASSAAAPQKLVDACQASDALTVEAWLTPASLTATGPGRVVTLSADAANRNFTLGQGFPDPQDVWTARVRTDTGPDQGTDNGIPNIWTPPGTTKLELSHVVFTHSEATGLLRFYLDGQEVDVEREGAEGTFLRGMPRSGGYSNWNSGYVLGLGWELDLAGDARAWQGVYHLIAVYCRELSAAEVMQNYSAGPE